MKTKRSSASHSQPASQELIFPISLNFRHGYTLIRPSQGKVPKEIEVPIYLIRHELQSRMLFKHLHAIGFQECYFETFLDHLILASLRMYDGNDENFKLYFKLIEKWSDHITSNDRVITQRALKVYTSLIKVRNRKDKKPEALLKKKQKLNHKAL